jgi:transcriptional regulator with XRE-family HTH domain
LSASDRGFDQQTGMLLRATRMARGWSLYQVAAAFPGRLEPMTLRSWEIGSRAMTAEKLAEIAAFYRVPVIDLIPTWAVTPEGSGTPYPDK